MKKLLFLLVTVLMCASTSYAVQWLREGTAATVKVGPMISNSDGYTPKTALAIAPSNVLLSKNGGTFAAKADPSNCVYDANGFYNCTISAADTGTAGRLVLSVSMAATLPVWEDYTVVAQGTYDALVSGSAILPADVTEWNGGAGPLAYLNAPVSNAPSASQIDAYLSNVHGSGAWGGASSVALPVMQGQVYSAVATQYQSIKIVQGDTPSITFNLGANYTGWTPEFAASPAPGSPLSMPLRNAAWTSAALGEGQIALSASDTATPGIFMGELKLVNGSQVLTAMRFKIQVLPAVVQ